MGKPFATLLLITVQLLVIAPASHPIQAAQAVQATELAIEPAVESETVVDSADNPVPTLRELESRIEALSNLLQEQAETLANQQKEIRALRQVLKGKNLNVAAAALESSPRSLAAETTIPLEPTRNQTLHPTAGWSELHPFISSDDGNFNIEFGGRAIFDFRAYSGSGAPPNSFHLRRARLKAEGTLFRHYEYEVETEFTDTETPLRDGFININYMDELQIKVGQFKVPFSQEELISTKFLEFVENVSVNELVPGRNPGVTVHGELFGGAVRYATGAYNGLGKMAPNTSDVPEAFVRLRFVPFHDGFPGDGFQFGGAFARGEHEGGQSVEGHTASKSVTFFESVPVNGRVERMNAEFAWRYRNWSLRGEFDRVLQARRGLGPLGETLPSVVGEGYFFQGTYLLTGEEKGERGIIPRSPFLTGQKGLGAWELAFRYENLRLDDSSNTNRSEAYTFGLNWWLTRFVRFQSNFVLERFGDPGRSARPGEKSSFSYLSRLQVYF